MARGRFGGNLHRDLLTVELNLPIAIRLKLNGDKVTRRVGQRLATKIRSRLRKGLDGDGSPLPQPESGGRPLKASGDLIRSIKYIPRLGLVAPSVRGRDGVSERARSNFGLMSIHISGVYTRKGAPLGASRPDIDPMGQLSDTNRQIMVDETNREISRQLARNEAGLQLEIGKAYRGAARRAGARRRRRR